MLSSTVKDYNVADNVINEIYKKTISPGSCFHSYIINLYPSMAAAVLEIFREDDMAIIKHKLHDNYTVISNEILKSPGLSFGAKGLLCELLSLPHDWTVHKTTFIRGPATKYQIDQLFKELKDAGYLEIIKNREGQRIVSQEWIVYGYVRQSNENTPKTFDSLEPRVSCVKRSLSQENQTLLSKDNIINKDILKNTNKKHTYDFDEAEKEKLLAKDEKSQYYIDGMMKFNDAWSFCPDRLGTNNKKAAFRQWDRRLREGEKWEDMSKGILDYQKYCNESETTGTPYVMMASTFLGRDMHFKENWEEKANAARASRPKAANDYEAEFRAEHGIRQQCGAL